ncbi:Winged helix DNA-binding domain-containing protein [Goodfellowiella coeruleoviolacea]|uniref:Winged helix DNA-binding domain-containing protein n=1 Tax=Goodfellowiella coeruleoviolacea TaxID=334858 RepID=A0AAE3G828_9PSEU|nr:Winged helix DNA-binding domain-containing protein [Goodfellowiella coeruleoviolacea]
MLRAYLAAHGPATLADFGQWLFRGASTRLLKGWLAAVRDELTEVTVDGAPAYARTADLDQLRETRPSGAVRLLPAFDQYVLAANRSLIPAEHRGKVSRTAGWISPVVLLGGRVAGVWTVTGTGEISVDPFEPIPPRALAAEVARVQSGRTDHP